MRLLVKILMFLLLCLVLMVGVLFAVQNPEPVPLNLLLVELPERSVALWVLLGFACGGIIGMLTSLGMILRLRTSLLRANRRLSVAGKELELGQTDPSIALEKTEV
ncbi:LapA family protein [Halieaceae bacterium IMCC14734]|uniref:LapA family protein n=1 Tax=Candidatus Litorirhabdus singularis TaxID=2518993 RepID=A0ABT3TFV2_9GAMM|nr:LapA family protein [Candidatus Litorirhabdus singularis]MCX2981173.1 LapA family protein [Candidatus Litorirhabdus singularis]